MKVALDTNLLVCFEGLDDELRGNQIRDLMEVLSGDAIVIPRQVLGELYNVMVRKTAIPRANVRQAILGWISSYTVSSATEMTFLGAIDLAATHQLTIWDALIVATTADAGCQLLLSEDMHHGFAWGGLTVVKPFSSPRHPLLEILLHDVK